MDATTPVTIRQLRDSLASCIATASSGSIIYIRNSKERGRPLKAALVSVEDAKRLEALPTNPEGQH